MWELRTHDQNFPLNLFDDNFMEEIELADFIFFFSFPGPVDIGGQADVSSLRAKNGAASRVHVI